jgi:hypothetical protein
MVYVDFTETLYIHVQLNGSVAQAACCKCSGFVFKANLQLRSFAGKLQMLLFRLE